MAIFGKPNIKKLKSKRDIQGLIDALGYQKNAKVRRDAILALKEINATQAAPAIVNLILDPDNQTRQTAVQT